MSSRDENLAMLLSMGFLQNRAEKAIFLTKNKGVQEAIDWYVILLKGECCAVCFAAPTCLCVVPSVFSFI
jgi:uncharacterized UBP type Zn finger protein